MGLATEVDFIMGMAMTEIRFGQYSGVHHLIQGTIQSGAGNFYVPLLHFEYQFVDAEVAFLIEDEIEKLGPLLGEEHFVLLQVFGVNDTGFGEDFVFGLHAHKDKKLWPKGGSDRGGQEFKKEYSGAFPFAQVEVFLKGHSRYFALQLAGVPE